MPTLVIQSFDRPDGSNLITRVSTATDGTEGNSGSFNAQFSPDGRYVMFESDASNLVAGDTNNRRDVFRKDLMTGEIVRVSTAADGTQTNDHSYNVRLSANGRYVVFESYATNLVAGDTNNQNDIFRKDLTTGEIVRVSTATDGSEGNTGSYNARISSDGRYVVFESEANDLVAGDTNNDNDIFRKDLVTGEIVLLSTAADGTQGNSYSSNAQFSAGGRYVLFESEANNLVVNDTNNTRDIFRKDLVTGEVVRVSTSTGGAQAFGSSSNAQFSPDGRYVMFESDASGLVAGDTNNCRDIFRKDLVTGELVRVSAAADGTQTNGQSSNARFSADGRYVMFQSDANNLVAGDTNNRTDIFRKDMVTGEVVCLSTTNRDAQGDEQANGNGGDASYSPDGRFIVIGSDASNLVNGDSNGSGDIFLVDAFFTYRQAMEEKRFAFVKLGVGGASSVTMAWGDGTVETVAPTLGSAVFTHAYATSGLKAALVTVKQGTLTWHVPHRIDLVAGQMVRNTALADTLVGSTGKDTISGDAFANIAIGGSGNDTIKGNSGNDRLYGGSGYDVLSGGSGKDIFVFNTRPSKTSNLDTITDFNPVYDTLWLDNAVFTKLGRSGSETRPVKLNSKFFKIGSKAGDANDYLIYNNKTGALYYDSNGSASGGMVQVAKLKAGLKITYNDFYVV